MWTPEGPISSATISIPSARLFASQLLYGWATTTVADPFDNTHKDYPKGKTIPVNTHNMEQQNDIGDSRELQRTVYKHSLRFVTTRTPGVDIDSGRDVAVIPVLNKTKKFNEKILKIFDKFIVLSRCACDRSSVTAAAVLFLSRTVPKRTGIKNDRFYLSESSERTSSPVSGCVCSITSTAPRRCCNWTIPSTGMMFVQEGMNTATTTLDADAFPRTFIYRR